jgi:Flp pilus assembly pilin Flp
MAKNERLRQRGQGMTEYIIIVALIVVSAIGTYQLFGQAVRNQTAGIAAEISIQRSRAESHRQLQPLARILVY